MTHFGNWLRSSIEKTGLSQPEFAARIGLKFWSLRNWIRSPRPNISGRHRETLSRGLKISRSELDRMLDDDAMSVTADTPVGEEGVVVGDVSRLAPEIPTFDLSVSGGPWCDVVEAGEVVEDDEIELGLFRVWIAGDSMSPDWANGSLVEFRCLRQGVDALAVGRDYYIQRQDNKATFKRLEKIGEKSLAFVAVNRRKFPSDIKVQRDQVVRMGLAVAKVTPVKSDGKMR